MITKDWRLHFLNLGVGELPEANHDRRLTVQTLNDVIFSASAYDTGCAVVFLEMGVIIKVLGGTLNLY